MTRVVEKWANRKQVEKHSQVVRSACPSLDLKESFESAFLLKLDVAELNTLLFSTVVLVEAIHGMQVFGRILE